MGAALLQKVGVTELLRETRKARPRCFSVKQAQEIRYLKNRGFSCRRLATYFGCHHQSIHNCVVGRGAYRELGSKPVRQKPKPISAKEREQIEELIARDYTDRQISRIFSRPKTTIAGIRKNVRY